MFVPTLWIYPFPTRDSKTLDTVLLEILSSTTNVSYGILGLFISSNNTLFSFSVKSLLKRFLPSFLPYSQYFCHILSIFAIISYLFLTKMYPFKSIKSQIPIKLTKKIPDIVSEIIRLEWCRLEESNLQPTVYDTVALPIELSRRDTYFKLTWAPRQEKGALGAPRCL